MNSKNIKRHLNAKMRDWLENVDNEDIKKVIQDNAIVTGGALVSLLTGEKPHDYDVYFKTKDAVVRVAQYYIDKWNAGHPDKTATLQIEGDRVKCFISSVGVAGENPFEEKDDLLEEDTQETKSDAKAKYSPVFLSSNAITLSNKIQVVIRFYGEVSEIHKNYDFAHCTCSWSSWDNSVNLPNKALECIINKELYYIGSKYPLCSIIRTRKYLERGYHINAGQYVKMAMQLNELNLKDIQTLEDQLTGVDTGYFQMMIDNLRENYSEDGKIDSSYVIELVNKLF